MRTPRYFFASLLLLAACDGDATPSAEPSKEAEAKTSEAKKTEKAPAKEKAAYERILGTWKEDGGSEVTAVFTKDGLTKTYPKAGNKPIAMTYEVVKAEGDTIELSVRIPLGKGKTVPGDNQILKLSNDDRTLDMRNAKNGEGGIFKRQ